MPRILLTPEDMHRTAATLGAAAANYTGAGARIAIDATTIMPPAAAMDTAATVARVNLELAGIATRWIGASADLHRRAWAAEVADGGLAGALRVIGGQLDDAFFLGADFLDARKYFSKGKLNVLKWLGGANAWGRQGLKGVWRRNLELARSVAHRGSAAFHQLATDTKRTAGTAVRNATGFLKGATAKVQGAAGQLLKGRAGPVVKLLGKVVKKAAVPWSLYSNFQNSKSTSFFGKVTSSVLATAVTTVPVVAIADIATDGAISSSMDIVVSSTERAATGDQTSLDSYQHAKKGDYGVFWKGYADLW